MIRLLLVLTFLFASPAAAQFTQRGTAPARDNAITPQLVVDGTIEPGKKTELAILMRVKPGWHGYWLNPGAAGLPMSVDWTLPPGWSVGALRYPVPRRLMVAGIMNYVYEHDYALMTTISVDTGATSGGEIRAKMRWLACTDKVCVPEQGEARLAIAAGGPSAPDPRFDDWRQALPRPLASPAHFAREGKTIRLAIPLPATVALDDPYVYPATEGAVDYDAPQSFSRDGDRLIAHLAAGDEVPDQISGVLSYGPGQGLEFTATPGPVPKGTNGAIGSAVTPGLLAALLGALAGGFLLNLMPCVFPILAMKALHLARAGGNEAEARRDAVQYAAGAVLGTAALGGVLMAVRAAGEAAGWAFQLQDPRTTLLLLLLAVAITLNLLKLFTLPVLGGESRVGSLGAGALAAFVATPCSGPFMGVALGAALLLPLWGAVLVFAALGLGLALPFIAIAFIPWLRGRMPKPGRWMDRLQTFLAVPMGATVLACLWLLYRQAGTTALLIGIGAAAALVILLAAYGRLEKRRSVPVLLVVALAGGIYGASLVAMPKADARAQNIPDDVVRWSPQALATARASGKPVFLYFTADWCLTCKANEASAIDRAAVRDAFARAGVVVMAGDWTNGDPQIGRFLEANGRAGVPLYLWYAPGAAAPEELPQILTPSMLTSRATARR